MLYDYDQLHNNKVEGVKKTMLNNLEFCATIISMHNTASKDKASCGETRSPRPGTKQREEKRNTKKTGKAKIAQEHPSQTKHIGQRKRHHLPMATSKGTRVLRSGRAQEPESAALGALGDVGEHAPTATCSQPLAAVAHCMPSLASTAHILCCPPGNFCQNCQA